jgi:hypothetical protein
MLESRPARAHPPMVAGAKRTFAAARTSAASPKVIQSAAEGITQSFESEEELVDAGLELVDSVGVVGVEPAGELGAALVPLPPRSFFAQPDPLKWIDGAENSLRIVPSLPHEGQKFGPGSSIPWRMSARWSQAVQT